MNLLNLLGVSTNVQSNKTIERELEIIGGLSKRTLFRTSSKKKSHRRDNKNTKSK